MGGIMSKLLTALRDTLEHINHAKFGILFRPVSLWVGAHWSPLNKRLCVNLIPFFTVWVTTKDGQVPKQGFDIYRNDKPTLK